MNLAQSTSSSKSSISLFKTSTQETTDTAESSASKSKKEKFSNHQYNHTTWFNLASKSLPHSIEQLTVEWINRELLTLSSNKHSLTILDLYSNTTFYENKNWIRDSQIIVYFKKTGNNNYKIEFENEEINNELSNKINKKGLNLIITEDNLNLDSASNFLNKSKYNIIISIDNSKIKNDFIKLLHQIYTLLSKDSYFFFSTKIFPIQNLNISDFEPLDLESNYSEKDIKRCFHKSKLKILSCNTIEDPESKNAYYLFITARKKKSNTCTIL